MKNNKQVIFSLLAFCMFLLAVKNTVSANLLDKQRICYAQIKLAWDNQQKDTVKKLMPVIKNYPLYPYLEYRRISENLKKQSSINIKNFIRSYPTFPFIRNLKTRFINELARRADWIGLLRFTLEKPDTTEAQCNYYYAKWVSGKQKEAWKGAKRLWLTGKIQPKSCDALFDLWKSSGKQKLAEYLERVRLAMKVGNTHLIDLLSRNIPSVYRDISSGILQLAKNPDTILKFARTTSATKFTREMVITAFANIARKDVENARLMIPLLVRAQKFHDIQIQKLRNIVAWKLMSNNVTDKQARWRDEVVMHSNSTSLIESRIRIALANRDHHSLNTWIKCLSIHDKEKNEWLYWKADLLLDRGYKKEAKKILHTLMLQRGFYPMVAAQRLGEKYIIKHNKAPKTINRILMKSPEIARIHELMYWNLDNIALMEWINLIDKCSVYEKSQLARYAFNYHWWNLSIQATISGKLWDHLEERFPLAYQDLFFRYTRGKNIPQSYAMAIARQESAWNPKIRSPVGATGLMQIMPDTAVNTAKKFNILGYKSFSQLQDPEINIKIGTSYLEDVFQQFDNNRIFASAAYNAGTRRVKIWRDNSAGNIDAVAFVESIPFSETRSYVKNVLTYDLYYRYFMGGKHTLLSDLEWFHRY